MSVYPVKFHDGPLDGQIREIEAASTPMFIDVIDDQKRVTRYVVSHTGDNLPMAAKWIGALNL